MAKNNKSQRSRQRKLNAPKKQPQTRVGRTSRPRSSAGRPPAVMQLSTCARKYAKVLEDPFSGATACVPTLTNFPSMKHSVRARGIFTTGTNGFGYVAMAPARGIWNDANFVFSSDGTYAGTTVLTAAAAGVNAANSNSPYTTVMSSAQIKGRTVGAGLRVRNITALLNRGGGLCAAESVNHIDAGGFTFASTLSQDTAETLDATFSGWQSVVWHPQDEDDFDYDSFLTMAGSDRNNFTLSFIANAPSTLVAQQYEWEAYLCFEAKGTQVHGLTPSQSDPAGLAHVQNAVMAVDQRKPTSLSTAWRAAQAIYKAAQIAYTIYGTFRGRPQRPMIAGPPAGGPIIEEIN